MFQSIPSKPVAMILVFVMLVAPVIHADVIPPGSKYVMTELRVDLGPLADQAWSVHVVVRGDTFSSIAKSHYRDVARAEDIAKANPKVNPKKMKLGSRLELPPKKSSSMKDGKKVDLPTWRFYWWPDHLLHHSPPRLIGNKSVVQTPRYGGILVAIPDAQKGALDKAVKADDKNRDAASAWKKVKGLVYSKSIGGRRAVRIGSATQKIVVAIKVSGLTAKGIEFQSKDRNLGKDGKEITWQDNTRLPMLALSGVGLLLFGGLVLKRRRLPTPPIA